MPQSVDSLIEKPVKCIGCGKKIAEGHIEIGLISIPCTRCGVINVIGAKKRSESLRPREYIVTHTDTGSTSMRT